MMSMSILDRCPYCNGVLIWDHQRGDIVCSECGTVIDRIYIMDKTIGIEDSGVECSRGSRKLVNVRGTPRSYSMYMRMYRMIRNSSRDLMINEQRFNALVRGEIGQVNILTSPGSIMSSKLVDSDEELRGILDNIVSRIPRLASRTYKGKVTAALLIKLIYREKRDPGYKVFREVASKTGTSIGHVKRIYRVLRSIKKEYWLND